MRSVLIILLFALVNIFCQGNKPDLKILKSKNRMLYISRGKLSSNDGELVVMDMNTLKKTTLYSHFFNQGSPKLSPNGQFLITFYDKQPFNRPCFVKVDLDKDQSKVFDFRRRVKPPESLMELSNTFELLSDNELIFPYEENLYLYSFNNDSLQVLKKLEGKKILEILIDRKENKIAFSYQTGFDSIGIQNLAIYDVKKDKVTYFDKKVLLLNDWSPNGKKLSFRGPEPNIVIYDLEKNVFTEYKTDMGTNEKTFDGAYFLNDEEVIIDEFSYSELNGDLYLFDLTKGKIIKKLEEDNKTKYILKLDHGWN